MQLAEIDEQLDQLCEEIGGEPPVLRKRASLAFDEADAALDALANEAALQVPLPPPTRLPTDPPTDTDLDAYESFAPAKSSMPAGVSSSEPPPGPSAGYGEVPKAPSVPRMSGIPHRPPSSIPPVASSTFPSELPSSRVSERPPVSRSFAPPKFSESSVPPPTPEEHVLERVAESEPPPGKGALSAEESDIMDAISERPPEFDDVPSSVRPGRDEPTEVLDLEDDDLEALEDIEVEWDDDDAPTLQDDVAVAASPLQGGLTEEATQQESIAPALVESEIGSLAPDGVEVSLSSRPPSLSAATGGSQPPDEHDWNDEFEDAFDILVDPDDPNS